MLWLIGTLAWVALAVAFACIEAYPLALFCVVVAIMLDLIRRNK